MSAAVKRKAGMGRKKGVKKKVRRMFNCMWGKKTKKITQGD